MFSVPGSRREVPTVGWRNYPIFAKPTKAASGGAFAGLGAGPARKIKFQLIGNAGTTD